MAAPSSTSSRGELHAAYLAVPSHFIYMMGYTALGAEQSHLIPHPYMLRRFFLFPGYVPPDDTVDSESLVGIKPGDSGVVIRYQVENLLSCHWPIASLLSHMFIMVSQARYQH